MKIYKFYYKADKDDIVHDNDSRFKIKNMDDYIYDKYPLYAFTIDKNLYKEFKYERNMNNFIIIKSDMDKSDYLDYAETYREALLDKICLTIKDENGKPCEVPFAITSYEQIVLDDLSIEYLFGDSSYFASYKIFKKDVRKALEILQYPFFYRTITGDEEDEFGSSDVNIATNEFEILYSQFKGTFD